MILPDAFGVIAFLRDEPAADEVGDLIGSGDAGLLAPNVAEISDRLVRIYGQVAERVRDAIETLASTSGLTLRGVTVPDGWRAAAISRHYHRTECPISLADGFLLAAGPDDLSRSQTRRFCTLPRPSASPGLPWRIREDSGTRRPSARHLNRKIDRLNGLKRYRRIKIEPSEPPARGTDEVR